jgi:IS4 transposase
MNQGRTVFAQMVELLPRRAFDNAVRRYRGQRRVRTLSCMDQLLSMIFAQVTGRSSLRETVLCLRALGPRRYHCGIHAAPARSTLADANENRSYRIFEDTALAMIAAARLELPIDPDLRRLGAGVYAIDSTTIDLCLALFPWAHFRRRKAAVKAHTVFDVATGIPVFVRISPGKTHDLWMLDQVVPQPGAFYVMDKGYIDFARLYRIHQAGAFFVTRAKRNMDARVRQRLAVTPGGPVTSDRLVRLRGPKSRRLYPDTLRLVRYVDPQDGRRLTFLTNQLTLDPLTVALLYRKRWRIELFFKWVKQHLHIKAFFGVTPNAVKTQVWIAVIVYVLVVRLKHRHQLSRELNEILQVLSVTLSEKVPVFELFSQTGAQLSEGVDRNQLPLFNF